MNAFYDIFLGPFVQSPVPGRALLSAFLLSLSAAPIGTFLMLRRMSLTGDAMSHAILPGAAIGFFIFGLQIIPMTIGGLIAGIIVALAAGAVSRFTSQKEDASLAAFYLTSIALGVLIISLRGSDAELLHALFGSLRDLPLEALVLVAIVSSITLISLAILWRGLIAECLDPLFFRSVSKLSPLVHFAFLSLVILNLVGGFPALGSLLSVGIMILPATAARFWVNRVFTMSLLAVAFAIFSSYAGLLVAYHTDTPAGPAIILCLGTIYAFSLIFGKNGILQNTTQKRQHRAS